MFFTLGSDDVFEQDAAIRTEIANDFMREIKRNIPKALIEKMPRLPEMLLDFERNKSGSSHKTEAAWEYFASDKGKEALNSIYELWWAAHHPDDEEAEEEYNHYMKNAQVRADLLG